MKRLSSVRLALVTAAVLLASLAVAVVGWRLERPLESPRTAAELLRGVEQRYRGVEQLTAEATLAVTSRTVDRTSTRAGQLSLQRPGKLRWEVRESAGARQRSFISDGEELFLVDYAGKEIVKLHRDDDPLVLSLAFATGITGAGSLEDDYAAELAAAGDYQVEAGSVAVVLTPRVPGPRVRRLILIVDAASFEVRESIVECAHNRHRLVLAGVDTRSAPDPGRFALTVQSPALAGFRFVDAAL